MLGIIIGISSVIMIISVGNGIKSEVNGELNDMAGGQVAIYTDMQQKNQEEQVFSVKKILMQFRKRWLM